MNNAFLIGERDGINNNFQVAPEPFGITQEDRFHHIYSVGKSGMGKSTLLENMMTQDMESGRGFLFLDPHGDSAIRMLERTPKHRINDVIYFSPADTSHPIGINLFSNVRDDEKYIVVEHILSVFSHIWELELHNNPRLLGILGQTITALLDEPDATLYSVYRLLVDETFRDSVVSKVNDSLTRSFWESEFSNYGERERQDKTESTLTRVRALLSSPIIRNCIAQKKSRIDFDDITNNNKILICNLSKGRIGEQGSKLLGAIIAISLYLTTMRRAKQSENERVPFFGYIDEFQSFGTSVFPNLLSEARKYKIGLTIAHQFISQLDPQMQNAIFGNVGTILSFKTGSNDGEILSREFSGEAHPVEPHIFTKQTRFELHAQLVQEGISLPPFRGKTYPPFDKLYGNKDQIVRRTNFRYGTPREQVEHTINDWLNNTTSKQPDSMLDNARELANKRSGRCLSRSFIDSETKILWQCKAGHKWRSTIEDIERGGWCSECNNGTQQNIHDLKTIAGERGGECISNSLGENDSLLLWRCKHDHIWKARPSHIMTSAWCPTCSRLART